VRILKGLWKNEVESSQLKVERESGDERLRNLEECAENGRWWIEGGRQGSSYGKN
jgi:hypothetical protein